MSAKTIAKLIDKGIFILSFVIVMGIIFFGLNILLNISGIRQAFNQSGAGALAIFVSIIIAFMALPVILLLHKIIMEMLVSIMEKWQ